MEDRAMTVITTILSWLVAAAVGFAAAQEPAPRPQRFDYIVRADFFAGAAGDEARLQKVIDTCEQALAANPQHAEAMVWHGATVLVRASQAFQKGDATTGRLLFEKGVTEMTGAVALAPNNPGVLIPRGAVLLEATRNMPADMARPLVQSAVANYEHALEVQGPAFGALGDHGKGELLFGLADGWARLGDRQKARQYFERLIADAPGSGQVAKAREWLATGVVPTSNGSSCVGCHK
jgi:tetratricopeptide (TPR) repeat protein